MKQVKLFKALESEWQTLETKINRWIADSGANVIEISGNIAPQSARSHPNARENPSDLLLIVTYEPAVAAITDEQELCYSSDQVV